MLTNSPVLPLVVETPVVEENVPPPPPRQRKKIAVVLPRLPLPRDSVYTVNEVVKLLTPLDCYQRNAQIKKWHEGKLLLASRSSVYRRLDAYKKRKPIKEFDEYGRTRLLSNDELHNIGKELNKKHGATFKNKHMKEEIKKAMKQKVIEQGCVPLNIPSPHRTTNTNYIARLASMPNISVTNATIKNTGSLHCRKFANICS